LSRNRERTGATTPDTSTPAALTQNDSGDFSFVVPTDFVDLPTGGKYYPENHPLHGQDCIEIRHMTAKEEDILTSRTLLKKGIAVDRLLSNIIIDKRISPDSLFVGDKNAIIIAARISGYGAIYDTSINCPNCGEKQDYSFDLNDSNVYLGENKESFNVVDNNDGTFTTVLPKTKITATFKLLTGFDEKKIVKGLEQDRKSKSHEHSITRQLRNFLVKVNDHASTQAIDYVIDNIPSMDSRHLRLAYRNACPNLDLTQHFACTFCEHEQDLEVPLTADFFWPDR
jgi:hypothetical protein